MTKSEELGQIMDVQVDLMEALVKTLHETQKALVNADRTLLDKSIRREEELVKPFHELETERNRCVQELAGTPSTITALLSSLNENERMKVLDLRKRMTSAAESIMTLNEQNRVLIRNARRFVEETIRLITDDHRRQLIDERM